MSAQLNQEHKTRLRLWILLVSIIVVAGVALAANFLFLRERVSFSLDRASVRPGAELRLQTRFHNIWVDAPRQGGQVAILDHNGVNWWIDSRKGSTKSVNAGFASEGPNEFCPDLGPDNRRPSHQSEHVEVFTVLPNTPPGDYTIQVPANRYCFASNPGAVFTVTVTHLGGT
jgi:hypothetical protein